MPSDSRSSGGSAPSAGPPPHLVNLRDVGGLPLRGGGEVRTGVLYRSDAPLAGDRIPLAVPVWPPRTVVDLRSAAERSPEHPLAASGAEVHHFPLLDRLIEPRAARPSDDGAPRLARVYRKIISGLGEVAGPLVGLLGDSPGPVLIHCAGGKDRTGVLVAVILGLLGVDPAEIRADYRRTSAAMPALLRRRPDGGVQYRPDVLGVPDSAIDVVFATVGTTPDAVTGWLRRHGVPAPEIAAVRERLRADGPPLGFDELVR
ncbi:tyrosine-protein phosphatase [Parafrankia sp. FMc2]|uniref:tyrosine-protein phosphatase n=1 Tax=Parafrankia sp. FMc2 TaxID=3233196 RepID=UPI0034D475C3